MAFLISSTLDEEAFVFTCEFFCFSSTCSFLAPLICAVFLLLRWVLELVLWGTIIFVILSWLQPTSPAYGMVWRLMNPILGPISSRLPRIAGLDWSPLIVFLIVNALLYWVTPLSQGYFVSAWF